MANPGFSDRPRGLGGFSFFPPGIKFLLISNVGVFLFEMLFGRFKFGGPPLYSYIVAYFYLWPLDSGHFYPWQLFSYMFLHDPQMWSHIIFNMLALWMFGVEIENIWGTKKFLTYYFLCGLGGAASHLILSSLLGLELGPLLGASGAIFGVLIAFGLMFPNRPIYFWPLIFIGIPAKWFVAGYIALEVYMTWNGADNVSHLAHLGGAVTGIIYILATTGGHMLRLRKEQGSWQRREAPGRPSFFGRSKQSGPVEAEYRDINGHSEPTATQAEVKSGRVISQEEIDRILDKIAATGYQNLTAEERDILFEASRRMEEKR